MPTLTSKGVRYHLCFFTFTTTIPINFKIINFFVLVFKTTIISRQKQPSCKKRCGPVQNGQYKKIYEIQAGGQEMAVMVG